MGIMKKKKKPTALTIRKQWRFNPSTRFHTSKKGKRGYNRKDNRRIERDSL